MTFLVFAEDVLGTIILFVNHHQHLVVHDFCRCLGIWALERIFGVVVITDVRQSFTHSCISNHAVGALGDTLKVIHGSSGYATEEKFLRCTSAKRGAHLVEHLILGGYGTLLREIPSGTQGAASWHNAHLHQWVGVLAEPGDGGMSSLVDSDGSLLRVCHYLCLLLKSADDSVNGIEEVLLAHGLAVVACGNECRLVADIGNVGSRETRSLTREEVYVECLVGLYRFQMDLEYCLALVEVGQINMYLTVETSCTHQGRVKHICTVGSREDDYSAIGAESIHLGEEGVECVLTLVVASHSRILAAGASHGINLVDEDDARRLLLSLSEEVAHTACSHSHEHFHKVATAH